MNRAERSTAVAENHLKKNKNSENTSNQTIERAQAKNECSFKAVLLFDNPSHARTVIKAIKPDLSRAFKRSKSKIALKGKKLSISIKAKDLTALRASFNSIMKSIVVSDNILKAFG
ncbi:MAG: KEOPS complex subunit Pcc1 [Candidatus Diapherotrites archaeon]